MAEFARMALGGKLAQDERLRVKRERETNAVIPCTQSSLLKSQTCQDTNTRAYSRQTIMHLTFHVTASNVLKLLPPTKFACSAARGMLQDFRYNNVPNP